MLDKSRFYSSLLWASKDKSELKAVRSTSYETFHEVVDQVDQTSDYPEKLINYILMELENSFQKVGFLAKIYVEDAHRGQGIGRAFMKEYMDNVSPDTEIDFLFARYNNKQADGFDLIEFYKSYGFEPVRSFNDEMLMVSKGHEDQFKELITFAIKNPNTF